MSRDICSKFRLITEIFWKGNIDRTVTSTTCSNASEIRRAMVMGTFDYTRLSSSFFSTLLSTHPIIRVFLVVSNGKTLYRIISDSRNEFNQY